MKNVKFCSQNKGYKRFQNFHKSGRKPMKLSSSQRVPLPSLSEKAMAPHSSTLAWKITWTEEPGRLQSMGSLRVRHYWSDLAAAVAAKFMIDLSQFKSLFFCVVPFLVPLWPQSCANWAISNQSQMSKITVVCNIVNIQIQVVSLRQDELTDAWVRDNQTRHRHADS